MSAASVTRINRFIGYSIDNSSQSYKMSLFVTNQVAKYYEKWSTTKTLTPKRVKNHLVPFGHFSYVKNIRL